MYSNLSNKILKQGMKTLQFETWLSREASKENDA